MKSFIKILASAIVIGAVIFGVASHQTTTIESTMKAYVNDSVAHTQVLGSTLPIGGLTYAISGSGIAPSDQSITLQSLTIPQTGQPIQSSDLGSLFYITIDPGISTRQEIVGCTSVTQNNGGTATLLGCMRGLSPLTPYTASTTLQFPHAGGSKVIFSDPPQLFNQYAALANNVFISGQWTASSTNPIAYDQAWGITSSSTSTQIPYVSWIFNNFVDLYDTQSVGGVKTFTSKDIFNTPPTSATNPTANTDVANKQYVDGVAVAGAPNANITTKGIVQEATIAQINSNTDTGSTGAKLFMTPLDFSVSNFASTTKLTTFIPKPYAPLGVTSNQLMNGQTLSASTTARVGLVNIPNAIDVNSISMQYSMSQPTGALTIGVYSENGQTQIFSTTTNLTVCSGGCNLSFTLPTTKTLIPGNYYLAIVASSTNTSQFLVWNTVDTPVFAASLFVQGKEKWEGTYTTTAGTLPSTLTPSLIATSTISTMYMRLDN